MDRTSIPARSSARLASVRLASTVAALAVFAAGGATRAADPPRAGLVDLGQTDAKLAGFQAPSGFKLELIADDPTLSSPVALTFDDSGRFYVAESSPASRTFDVWETVPLGDGTRTRLHRRRKPTTDTIKRLSDTDGDGKLDSAEVVVEGVEQPTGLLWIKGALYVTALGRLERWNDADADGRFETRTILIDGFGAVDGRGLAGLTLGNDGYLYLTAGDNETHAFNPGGGSRVDLARTGGLFRCRLDGTELQLVAAGFRNPRGAVAFDAAAQPILIDDDGADGSKLAGVRLIQPIEGGDYGWRSLAEASAAPDLELGTVDGDRAGKLTGFGRVGSGVPAAGVLYNGIALPEACRGLFIAIDPGKHAVRGFKINQDGPTATLVGETTLLVGDDDRFRPEAIVVGADSAVYLLDSPRLAESTEADTVPPPRSGGRIYRLTGTTVPALTRDWDQITSLINDHLLFKALPSLDYGGADRALRELVDRGQWTRPILYTFAANTTLPTHVRLLGIQGARQFWNDDVQNIMNTLLTDTQPEVRRLAAQTLALEPKRADARLMARLLERLEDPDGRVVREVALAIGRHGETNPRQPGAALVRWLYAHPQADPATRDGVLRGIERLGDVGVDEVALAVRTRRGLERETAVRLYSGLRSAHAAEELTGLVKIPDLSAPERATLVRQFADFAPDLAVSTTALVEWLVKHPDVEPIVKRAALETCRLVGNPASTLVLACLEDEDEAVRIAATDFAARTRPPGAMSKLADRVGDANRSDAERLAAARGLRWGGPAGFAALDAAFLGSDSPDFRRTTLRSMADADRARALAGLTSTLSGPDPTLRDEAIAILGETPAGALTVGRAYLDGTLTRADLPAVLRGLRRHDTKEVRPILTEVKKHATSGPSALSASALRLLAVESGNPWAGLEVFGRTSARCSSCHQVAGQGGHSGPKLDFDAHGLSAEQLIEAIYQPSRTIKPGYEPARLAMSGATESSQGKTASAPRSGKPTAPLAGVDRARIATDPAKHPAMSTGLDLDLTPRELADLIAYLLDPTVQATVKRGGVVPIDRWVVAGPFAPGADALRVALDRVDLGKTLAGAEGRELRWGPLAASSAGRIDLGGWIGTERGQAYAAAQVRTAAAQSVWLYASTRGAVRVYLDGAEVAQLADRSTTVAEDRATDGPTSLVKLPLKAGGNLILVAFDAPASGAPVSRFRLAGSKPVEVRAPKPGEGSPR